MTPGIPVQVRGVGGSFESIIESIDPDGGIAVRNPKGRRLVVAPDHHLRQAGRALRCRVAR